VIARSDPIWSGALAVGAGAGLPRASLGPLAVRAGDGALARRRPQRAEATTSGSTAIVFDDRSGEIVSRCNGIAATTATRDLAAATSPRAATATGSSLPARSGSPRRCRRWPPTRRTCRRRWP
jgi:hypothetical protein